MTDYTYIYNKKKCKQTQYNNLSLILPLWHDNYIDLNGKIITHIHIHDIQKTNGNTITYWTIFILVKITKLIYLNKMKFYLLLFFRGFLRLSSKKSLSVFSTLLSTNFVRNKLTTQYTYRARIRDLSGVINNKLL